jgi:hypothetical protein
MVQAKKKGVDLNALGQRIRARKAELQGEGDDLTEEPLKAPSIHLQNIESTSEEPMSQYGSQRSRYEDERYRNQALQTRGRSYMQMDEEDDGAGGIGQQARDRSWYESDEDRYASGQDFRSTREDYGARCGRSRPRDEEDERSSRRGWTSRYGRGDDQDRGYRGRGQESDRDQQRYRGGRSRYGEDENYGYQGRGQDRDEYDRFMSEDDAAYSNRSSSGARQGSQSSRGGRDSGSRDGQEHRGWYGDHRGHSQAARRGWQKRE